MTDQRFDLMAAKLEHAKQQLMDQLNAELFSGVVGIPVHRLTRRERMQRRIERVRHYLHTLWMALKGEDPYDDYSDY